jgi:hypothetical protein
MFSVFRRRFIDFSIKNAIIGAQTENTYARLKGSSDLFEDNIGQEEVCLFLRELLRHLRDPETVLLYDSSNNKGKPLRELVDRHLCLTIAHFP